MELGGALKSMRKFQLAEKASDVTEGRVDFGCDGWIGRFTCDGGSVGGWL
jgi:hypothetical protein